MAEGEPVTLSFLFLKQQLLDLGKNYVLFLLRLPSMKCNVIEVLFTLSLFSQSRCTAQLPVAYRATSFYQNR